MEDFYERRKTAPQLADSDELFNANEQVAFYLDKRIPNGGGGGGSGENAG